MVLDSATDKKKQQDEKEQTEKGKRCPQMGTLLQRDKNMRNFLFVYSYEFNSANRSIYLTTNTAVALISDSLEQK